MRICHFEDLLFEKVDVNKIIHNIAAKKYPVSVKWDGSPPFVVGRDHYGFFLAFKSGYLKKEPELFRKFEELAQKISDPDLLRIMSELFIAFQDMKLPHVLHGDFLFDMYTINNGRFQPNLIPYNLFSLDMFKDYALGVAIHTVGGRMGSWAPTMPINMLAINVMATVNYDVQPFTVNDASDLSAGDKTLFKKYVNSRVRQEKWDLNISDLWHFWPENKRNMIVNHQTQWTNLILTYMKMAKWKNKLLETMSIVNNHAKPAPGFFHEGLVIDTGDKLVKMVDRLGFSAQNFKMNKERTRGREVVS